MVRITHKSSALLSSALVLHLSGALACLPASAQAASAMQMSSNTTSDAKPEGKLTPIPPSKVCMVNNTGFNKDQIPVPVRGKTYYGCCAMCKHLLQTDPAQRTALDPISKEKIDKSQAVIGMAKNGAVLYFQNQHDLDLYNSRVQ